MKGLQIMRENPLRIRTRNRAGILLFFVTLFFSSAGLAQQTTVKGSVMSEAGSALPNVSVQVKGTTTGTATDSSGNFSIVVPDANAVLVFSSVGYTEKEEALNGRSELAVVLTASSQSLEQVVVIGYGRQRKSDLTGSVAVLTSSDLSYQATANAAQSLQGKVAGVQVTNQGAPGTSPTIRIRGLGSVRSNVDPLYVVDGVLTNDISFLSNNDIESMSILKDASASAIYGIRAANGVVVITTKRGKSGKANIYYSGYAGVQKVTNRVQLANGSEYIELLNEKDKIAAARANNSNPTLRNPGDYPNSTNWYDEILRNNAMIQNHELGFSGGTENVQYALGGGYFRQEGIAKGNQYERINVRGAVDAKVTSFLKVGGNLTVSGTESDNLPNGLFSSAYVGPSSVPVRGEDGSFSDLTEFGSFGNPAASLFYNRNRTKGLRLVGGVYAEVYLMKGLTFKSAYGIDRTNSDNRIYIPRYNVSSVQRDTTQKLTKKVEDPSSYYWDNTLTYDFTINKDHRFTALIGTNIQQERIHTMTAARLGVPDYGEESWYLNLGDATGQTSDESISLYRARSVFGRLNYSFAQKYLLTATLRRDAASIFPKSNQVDYFPSVGLGWVISQERFMEDQSIFQLLKLRGSWGKMGNSRIPNSVVIGVSTGGNYSQPGQTGSGVDQVGPANLLWETTNETDIALEMALLKSRLTFEVDYYNKLTKNSIFSVTVNSAVGASNTSYLDNNADIKNAGFEFNLRWKDKVGEFNYAIGGNLALNRNEVVGLRPGTVGIYGGYVNFFPTTYTTVGQSIGQFYGRQVVGIFQNKAEIDNYKTSAGQVIQPGAQPGDFKFADINNDGVINDYDRVFLGSSIPKYNFGANLYLEYKGVDLTVDVYGQGGNKIYNAKRYKQLGNENYDKDFYDNRWHGEGTSNTYPSADLSSTDANKVSNSWYVESGNFFKIRNLQLGYNFSQNLTEKIGLRGLRVYFNAVNPFNFFKYNGFTPEITNVDPNAAINQRVDAISQGVDNNVYPMSAIYNFGININL
jgi:TonB-linked SusC/RagA family outer membrane protein